MLFNYKIGKTVRGSSELRIRVFRSIKIIKLICKLNYGVCFTENIIWASAGRSISMLNMSSGLVETISNDQNDFIVSGSESLFVLQFEYEGDTQLDYYF